MDSYTCEIKDILWPENYRESEDLQGSLQDLLKSEKGGL